MRRAIPVLVILLLVSSHGMLMGQSSGLTYTEESAIGPLNPYEHPTKRGNAERLFSLIYEGLLRYDHERNQFENLLVTRRNEVAPGRYRVELDRNISWHDGEPLTAEDVVFTYRYIIGQAALESLSNFISAGIREVRSIGEYTVEFVFNEQVQNYDRYLDKWILPSHLFDTSTMQPLSQGQSLARNPVGTGPYRFENRTLSGLINLSRFKNYHQTDPSIPDVTLERVADIDTRIQRLLAEQSDLLIEVPPRRISQIEAGNLHKLEPYQSYSITTIGFNLQVPKLQDRTLRHAIIHGTDRQQMLTQWYNGRGEVLAGPFTQGAQFFNPDLEPRSYDPERARALLQQAGYQDADGDGYVEGSEGERLKLQLLVPTVSGAGDVAQQNVTQDFVEMMEAIGIRINVVNEVQDEYRQSLAYEREFELAWVEWVFDPVYDITSLFHSNSTDPGESNVVSYSNSQVDQLFNRYVASNQPLQQTQIMYRIQSIIAEDAPYMFMFSVDNHAAIHTRFVNTVIDPYYFFSEIQQWESIY